MWQYLILSFYAFIFILVQNMTQLYAGKIQNLSKLQLEQYAGAKNE